MVAVLLVAVGTVVYTVPPLRDEAEWRWATFQDGEADYAAYLGERPEGRHTDEARRRYDEKSWEIALTANAVLGYERYLRAQPGGRYARDARERIDSLHWERAQAANTIQAYETYLSGHPGGAYAGDARKRFEALKWELLTAQITDLACDGVPTRRIPIYRAPSLYRTQTFTKADPTGVAAAAMSPRTYAR